MKRIIFSLAVLATSFTACKKDDNHLDNGIFKGPEVQVHDGKAWTWIKLDQQGKPEQVAIAITDKALNSVPVGVVDEGGGAHDHSDPENMWELKFHQKASVTPFKFVALDWNPVGHEPEPIYGKPHFDFHFYMTSAEEVEAIPPYDVAPEKFDNWPAPEYFPTAYFNGGGGVPQMGAHWVDANSPEFHGETFTQTFIYGSYDGKVTFYEPMITLDFLKNTGNFERAIPQPAKFQTTGYYPTKLRVIKHDGLTEIILDAFVYRTQS
jgi:hypothetical protein